MLSDFPVLARGAVCAAALALLAACGDKPAGSPAPSSASPAAPAVQAPASAPEASPAAASASAEQAGVDLYPHQNTDVLRQGAFAERLRTLLGPQAHAALLENLRVSGPLSHEGDVWFVTGNRPHEGGSEQAAIAYDGKTNALRVWLHHAGQEQEFVDPPGAQVAWPQDIRTLLKNTHGN